jgi:hypothetical protein
MADELLDRLEGWQDYEPARMFGGEILKDVAEAAAELARLRAENERLFTANGKLANTLGAENLRLRGALDKIIGITLGSGPCDNGAKIHKLAHEALTNG